MSLELLIEAVIENQEKILEDMNVLKAEFKSVRKTVNINKDAIDNISDIVHVLNEGLDELKEAVESQIFIASEDIGEQIGVQIEAAMEPIIELQNEKIENTCRKMISFILRYAKSVEDKDRKLPPIPFKETEQTSVAV